jgi:serine/threonine protein phosphatase 1
MPPHQLLSPQRHSPQRHWIIGDVHGCADALAALVGLLPRDDRLVFCGDVINRGPDILGAMELAWELVTSGRGVWLMGNHERDLVDALRGTPSHPRLVGCDTYRQLGHLRCSRWLERLEQLPLVYWGQGWAATHAGFDPVSWEPHLRIRMAFWQAYDGRYGDVIVGHTPGACVRKLGHVVLIDTGACYGGQLTAYCPETGAIHSVQGRHGIGEFTQRHTERGDADLEAGSLTA